MIGGVVATILGIAYHASGIFPSRAELAATAATAKADSAAGDVAALASRVSALEAAPAGATTDAVTALDARVAALGKTIAADEETMAGHVSGIADIGKSVGDLSARIDDLAKRVVALETRPAVTVSPDSGDTSGLSAALADMESRLGRVTTDVATIAALRERVAAVEESVKAVGAKVEALAAQPPPNPEGERAARAVAVTMVRQAAATNAPFAEDLATLGALGVDGETIAALQPLAEKGVPTAAALRAGFPEVADAILAATSTNKGGGILDSVAAFGRGLVTIRPTTAIAGDTPAAIVSRMQAAVDGGDLAAALKERSALPAEGQAASSDWTTAAADRIALDRLVAGLASSTTTK